MPAIPGQNDGANSAVAQFIDLGPYGGFVWSAWGIALAALGGLLAASLVARARVRRELRQKGLDRRARREGEAS